MKNILLLLLVAVLASCNKEEEGEKVTSCKEYTITVASKKLEGIVGTGSYLSNVYAVKTAISSRWEPLTYIQDFDYEPGCEYVIKISEINYLDYRRGDPAWTEYKLMEVISKEKKDSEELPEHFIPDWYIDK